jgi:CBS domain-containing protein
MRVSDAMTADVRIAAPNQSIQDAAQMMAEIDAGVLPVGDNDRLVGVITDRDIAVRAVAKGLPPSVKVRDVMSHEVMYCFDDEDIDDVAQNMADIKVRRLPVLNRSKRLVGIVSLGDIAMAEGPDLRHIGAGRAALAGGRWTGLTMALTSQEIVARVGRVDDLVIAAIIESGATREELDEACAWIANDEPLINSGRRLAAGRVGQIVDLLMRHQEDQEALLESGR